MELYENVKAVRRDDARTFELEPASWLEFLGILVADPSQVQVIDSNVSTITAESDKVVRVGGKEPFIVHTEVLSGRNLNQPEQAHWYNTLLGHRHKVPVWTAVVLLRPAADGPELNGLFERTFPGRGQNLWFRYDVIRIWLQPPARLLEGGLPVIPLAPVSDVDPDQLAGVVKAVAERLRREAGPELRMTLWAATQILMGLKYPKEKVSELTKEITTMVLGIQGIEESSVYQDIFAKGEARGEAGARPRAVPRKRGRSCSAWAARRWGSPMNGYSPGSRP